MTSALVEANLIATAGFLSVGQILLVLVLLSSPGGLRKAAAYAVGMSGVLLAIGQSALLLGSKAQAEGGTSPFTSWGSIGLGVLLVAAGIKTWRKPASESPPNLLGAIDSSTPLKLLAFGAFIGAFNVKNLAIYLAAVDVIVRAKLPTGPGIAAVALTTLVFCSFVFVPLVAAAVGGRHAKAPLAAFRRTLERHQRPLAIWVMLIFGVAFAVRGVLLLG